MKKPLLILFLFSLYISSYAQTVPKKAFYAGIGAGFNLAKFSDVDANTLGLSNVYFNGKPVASGFAGGPYIFPENSESRFGPDIQVGYYQLINKSKFLWGAKFTYNYIGTVSVSEDQNIPQVGAVGSKSFTGDAVVQSFEYSCDNQFTLTPYFGISTKKTFFYLGGGATYTQTKENINNVVGYAYAGDEVVNISGDPISFSSTGWSFGFAALAGGTYFFNSSLFIDFTYTYCQTGTQTNDFFAQFTNTHGKIETSGDLIGSTSTHAIINSFTFTFNKAF